MRRLGIPSGGMGGCGAGCARAARGSCGGQSRQPGKRIASCQHYVLQRLWGITNYPHPKNAGHFSTSPQGGGRFLVTGEIICASRMAPLWPAPRAPVIDHAKIAHKAFEAIRLAHHSIGRMPEPGRGNRLKIAAFHLVFVIFQHAFRRANMEKSETETAEARQ